ncbi:MAG: MATE family efflux transporter [Candidatus Omnitrophota bacterium]|jgi:putative MATE family efflux protein
MVEFVSLLKNEKIRAIARESWRVSWPMTIIMLCVFLIGLTDVYVAGRLGKEIQASYGFATQFYFIFTILASALSIGSVSVISRLFTSHREEEFKTTIDSAVTVAIFGGMLFSVLGFVFAKNIVSALNVPQELKVFVVPLTRIFSLGLLFSYLFLNTNAILRACGLVRKSLWTMAIVCVLNIALNFILVLMTPLKFKGIALATAISMLIGSILNLFYMRKLISGFFVFSLNAARNIFSIGWPAGLLQIFWQVGYMVIYLLLSAIPEHNIEILAAFTNGLKVEAAVFLPAFAFNMANAVVVGNLLGKKNREDAYSAGLVTAFVGVIIVVIMALAILFNARTIASFLSGNEEVVKQSMLYIYISMLFEPFMAWGVILSGALQGAGDTKSVMFIVGLSMWLVRIPLCYILGIYFGFGAIAVWWSMNASILVQSFFVTGRYFSQKWIKKGLELS